MLKSQITYFTIRLRIFTDIYYDELSGVGSFLRRRNRWNVSDTPRLLWISQVHYHFHNSLPVYLIFSQLSPIHILAPYFFDILLNIYASSTSSSPK
jgi:hypothetical protein